MAGRAVRIGVCVCVTATSIPPFVLLRKRSQKKLQNPLLVDDMETREMELEAWLTFTDAHRPTTQIYTLIISDYLMWLTPH